MQSHQHTQKLKFRGSTKQELIPFKGHFFVSITSFRFENSDVLPISMYRSITLQGISVISIRALIQSKSNWLHKIMMMMD